MRNTIAVAGNMIIDKIKLLRAFPARHELTGILSVEESLGGAACNVGMDLARLDPSLPVRVFGVAGADANIRRNVTHRSRNGIGRGILLKMHDNSRHKQPKNNCTR